MVNDITLEKISIDQKDFSDNLNNDFGIQDTQVIASNDLQNFLLSSPDEVKNIQEEKRKQEEEVRKLHENEKQNEKQNSNVIKTPESVQAKPDGKDALEDILYNTGDNNQQPNNIEDKNSDDSDDSEEDRYTVLGKDLMNLGIFTKNSEEETIENLEIKTPEEFRDRWNTEKKKGAIDILDNFLSQKGDRYREMFDAVFVNGIEPEDYLNSFVKIDSISNLDLTNEDNQAKIVRSYYKSLNWDDTKVENKIQKLKDYGDLEEEATSFKEVLINKEKETLANKQKIENENKRLQEEKDIESSRTITRILNQKLKEQEFDGIPLTEREIQEDIAYQVNKPYRLQNGNLITQYEKDLMELNRPENQEDKTKLGLLLRRKLKLSSVKINTISKKSDALFTLSTKNSKDQKQKGKGEVKSFFS